MTTENAPEIRTNNQPRELLSWFDLTEKEKAEFDWYSDFTETSAPIEFFRYKGNVYTLGDFMRLDKNSPFPGDWHGYKGDSFFSGLLIRLDDTGESVVVGQYIS
jgi:hypothetical protein